MAELGNLGPPSDGACHRPQYEPGETQAARRWAELGYAVAFCFTRSAVGERAQELAAGARGRYPGH